MSTHEDIARKFEEKTPSDRSFGRVFAVFFLLVGLLPTLRHGPLRLWALAVSGLFLLITIVRPTLLSGAIGLDRDQEQTGFLPQALYECGW